MRKNSIIIILIIFLVLLFNSCNTFSNFIPIDRLYYPQFGNGYDKDILLIITDNKYGRYKSVLIETKNSLCYMEDNIIIKSIEIYSTKNIIIKNYGEDLLNNIRQSAGNPENEFWCAYEDGLILIPEDYHNEKSWQKYIESIKTK